MTALAANKTVRAKGEAGEIVSYPVADNVHIYQGALVGKSSGYAKPAAGADSVEIFGIAAEEADNTVTGHTLGGISVRVEAGRQFLLTGSGFAQSDVGAVVYVTDDNLITKTAGTSLVGRIVRFKSSTQVWVWVPEGGQYVS